MVVCGGDEWSESSEWERERGRRCYFSRDIVFFLGC
jgi:hypothetical protein